MLGIDPGKVRPYFFLHIGVGKTGTSAIQSMLAANVGRLLEYGVIYPDDVSLEWAKRGRISSGNGLPVAKLMGFPLPDSIDSDSVFRNMDAAIGGNKNILYSSEVMTPAIFSSTSVSFLEKVRKSGFNVRIIVYFRSIADHALSYYHQNLKEGRTSASFGHFIKESYPIQHQNQLARLLVGVASSEEVLARNYDTASSDIVGDFLSHCLGFRERSEFTVPEGRINRSLSWVETELMRVMVPLFDSPAQARAASDALLMSSARPSDAPVISKQDFSILENEDPPPFLDVNKIIRGNPIGLKSDRVVVADNVGGGLSEAERALGALIGGIIRFSDVTVKND